MRTYEVEVEFTALRKFFIDAGSPGEAEAIAAQLVETNDYDTEGEPLEAVAHRTDAHAITDMLDEDGLLEETD